MNTRTRWLITPACLALILVLAVSCGRKTDPLTPDSPRPEAVKGVKAVTRDAVAFLSWRVPTKNVEGKDMNPAEILGFRIFRAEIGDSRKKPRYKEIADISMANPAPAEVRAGTVFWSDKNLRYGQVYSYRIRAASARGGSSQQSEEVRVAPLLSLAAPKDVTAVAGDSRNLLSWDLVTTRSDGSQYTGFVGYNIYRGTEKDRYEDTPLNTEPLRTTSYKDTAAVNNKTYFYIVRAVDSPTLPWKESLDSAEVSATPRDMAPPERPKALTVVPGVGRIFLTWNENRERDLAGYNVYRSVKSGRDYERLTDKPINRTTFSDVTVKPGVVYYYTVTAVDQSGNESPMSKEQKAYAEKGR
jgi:fibronectin type 3 domain-containing protein